MCGRMVLTRSAREIADAFEVGEAVEDCELGPRYNVAPSQDILALRAGPSGARQLARLHWGLIPSWSKQRSSSYRMINARSETAAEKPSFREALRKRRCIVPIDGFYEWQAPPKGAGQAKVPHFFRHPEGRGLAIAGLWESWTDTETGEVVESCTLLTTEANRDVRPVHHRMPVFLPESEFTRWLDPACQDAGQVTPLLAPAAPGLLGAIEVSTRVNNPRNEDPRCIEAVS